MNLSSVTEVASGIQTCLKEGLALTVSIFGGEENRSPYCCSILSGTGRFFMLAQALMGHLCIYQAGTMKE